MKQSLHFFLISFTIFFSCIGEVFAQNQEQIDSLKRVITITEQDPSKVIQSKNLTKVQNMNLSIANPAGFYIVSIQADNKRAVIRLVKELN